MVIANAAKHKGRLASDARIEDGMNIGIVLPDLVELVDQQVGLQAAMVRNSGAAVMPVAIR